jgi:D-alanyl-lipoteichoic acid acyltransferase DltB (MBOAT superfamily)
MQFTANIFIFVFLPVALVFHISSEKAKLYVILALSVLFYVLCQRNAVMYGCILTALNVTVIMVLGSAGIEEQKTLRRTIMVAAIALNVGITVPEE